MRWLQTGFLSVFIYCSCIAVWANIIPVYQINEVAGTWVQTPLTHDIYRYTGDPSLNNLLVIDNDGNKLPYRIIAPVVVNTEKATQIPVRFFRVGPDTSSENINALNSASIRVYNNKVSVEIHNQLQDEKPAPVDFYVLDIADVNKILRKLVLDWNANETNQYLEMHLSGSRDLQGWEFLSAHTLVKLQKEGQSLIRNSIEFTAAGKDYNYLRLKCIKGCEVLVVTNVHAEIQKQQVDAIHEDVWEIKGALAADQQSAVRAGAYTTAMPVAAWEYEREDRAPVARIGINLGDRYYGDTIKVYSRRTPKQPWHLLYQGIWFNAQVGTEWQHSDAIALHANSDPYLRIELNESVGSSHNPVIVLKRTPQVLQFIANDKAPYRIAIDSQAASNNSQIHAQIFAQLVADKEQSWIDVDLLALEPSVTSPQAQTVNWKTILFWATLVIAVAILIGVALRLFKQMKTE